MSSERQIIDSGEWEFYSLNFTGAGTPFAGNGEAIIVEGAAVVTVDEGSFQGCNAESGGAVSIEAAGANVSIKTFDFTHNSASNFGGAIHVFAGALDLDFGYFLDNSVTEVESFGGAIYATGNSTTLSIKNTDFQGNSALVGGALYLYGISSCEIIDSRFLTGADSIYIERASSVVFIGENTISASVKASGFTADDAVRVADGAKLVFANTNGIEFDGILGKNNTIKLNNGGMVTLNKGINNDTTIIVNSGSEYVLVGEAVNVLQASGLSEDTVVTYKGVADSIANHDGLTFNAEDSILAAVVTFYDCVASQSVSSIGFAEPDSVYEESFTEVIAGCEKEIVGDIDHPDKYVINGDIFAAADSAFSMSNLTYGGHIYGGGKVEIAPESLNSCNLTLDNIALSATKVLKVTGEGFVNAPTITDEAQTEVSVAGSELNIGFVGTKKAGTVYGGAEIASEGIVYNAGDISTTVNGGYFGKIVGNGSTGNYGGTINQGNSTLTINGGVFYGRVYAGGYAMSSAANEEADMAISDIIGEVNLHISGGTFKDYVYGGSCAQYDYLANNNTHIEGDVTATIDSSENTVKFNTAVFAGSQSKGEIKGNTKIVFTGLGSNLDFSGCTNGIGRIYGGSQNERDYASDSHEDYLKCVSGVRSLEFNNFSGTMHADFFNFDTVTFSGSSVTLDVYTDLHLVDTWNFDVSSDAVNLNWNVESAENSFAGDTINLKGWDGATTRTFMAGSDAVLNDFDKANVKVYNGYGAPITSGYKVSRVDNTLQIAKA